jgi:hypothetical protein
LTTCGSSGRLPANDTMVAVAADDEGRMPPAMQTPVDVVDSLDEVD